MRVPFDPVNPPRHPPRGVDPLLWRAGHQVWSDHRVARDGRCTARACRDAFTDWPCPPRRLGVVALMAAAGTRAPWASLNRAGHFR